MYKIGWILEAFWDKGYYTVEFRDQYEATKAKRIDTGVEEPLDLGDEVLCLYTKDTNWIIMGRIVAPDKSVPSDNEKSEEQRLLEEHRKLIGQYISGETTSGTNDDASPNYRSEDEDPLGVGDAEIRSRSKGNFVRCDSSGSILAVVSNILCTVMDTFKNGLLHRCSQYLLDVIPGFRFKVTASAQQNAPGVPTSATPSTQPEHTTVEATLASDPSKNQVDFDLEAGALRDIDDPMLGKGRASKTVPYKIKRGARLALGQFGILEVDNEMDELRISFVYGADPTVELYQMRFNPKEATLSWGLNQFISLTDDGLLIKAKSIGLAGPLVMWDPLKTATFMHNQDLTKTDWAAVIRWDNTKAEPGLRIDKSIYFGDKGDPAVTKGYLDNVVDLMLTMEDAHTHQVTMIGAPTGAPIIPMKPVIQPFLTEPIVDTFLTIVKKPATPAT